MAEPEQDKRPEQTTAQIARDAAVQSLVSNAVYLAIVLGVTVGIARRDALARQAARARRLFRPGADGGHGAAMADWRRQVSEMDHSRPDWWVT